MRLKTWSATTVAVLALTLLSVVGPSHGEPPTASCCFCDCRGAVSCTDQVLGLDCELRCGQKLNGTMCAFEVFNTSCAAVPACGGAASVRAPALGTSGLTAVALLLASLGLVGLRRAARRKRR